MIFPQWFRQKNTSTTKYFIVFVKTILEKLQLEQNSASVFIQYKCLLTT